MNIEFHPEVPAKVQHVDEVRNGVRVQGGTNWDLARSAIATPIATMPEPTVGRASDAVLAATPYQPKHQMPAQAPHAVVTFTLNSTQLPTKSQAVLRAIPKGTSVVVAGHADSRERSAKQLAQKRAAAVAAYLRKTGKQVEETRSFGPELPLSKTALQAGNNRRVEVFTAN